MKRIILIIIADLVVVVNYAQVTVTDDPVTRIEEGLVPLAAFQEITYHDIAVMNGFDKTSDFSSFVNISLVDEPSIKLSVNPQKVSNKEKFKFPYYNNIGFEVGLTEDLTDLFKTDSKQFKATIDYTGTIFFNPLTSFKYYESATDALNDKLGDVADLVYANYTTNRRFMQINSDEDTTYYARRRGDIINPRSIQVPIRINDSTEVNNTITLVDTIMNDTIVEVYASDEEAQMQVYKKAEWNTKKYYWFAYKINSGVEGLNFYNPDSNEINKEFKNVSSLDLSFNFYHWVSPERAEPYWFGTKFISMGMQFAYQPTDQASQNDYITLNDSILPVVKNQEYEITAAYNKKEYSEIFRWSPYVDYYNFITKSNWLGIHVGVRGLFDKPLKTNGNADLTRDLNLLLGLVFNISGCYGDCDDDEKDSKVSFEILLTAKNIVANNSAGNLFRECLSPQLKVGIPFNNL